MSKRKNIATEILDRIDNAHNYLENIIFSDVIFPISGTINRHNVRIWASEQLTVIREHVRDSGKVNVWRSLMGDRSVRKFFVVSRAVTGPNCLGMLE
ncbi:hypothetical protein CEXT_132241 [Caerostris extrusa]|uniref:Uncharacterized protein n=1 Tax=Caerostris extrusa TaxID=172846 RepID=A0AAV4Y7U2_CAEEX|nr:hypothetical protein CEXT_132241 [Caerostris extrusa]